LKFEDLISNTIEETKEYPEIISETGKIGLSHKGLSNDPPPYRHSHSPSAEIMRKMGEVFLLRANIAAVGSVLDSPDVFWVSASTSATDRDAQPLTTSGPQSYPDLRPLYDAARSYLEIPQRINLLNTRFEVLQDMLQLLKESVSSRHSERLEQIVFVLIAIEISMFLSYFSSVRTHPDPPIKSLGSLLSSSTSTHNLLP
jgi:uncharacterized Rmd1/YagE family protein